MTTRIMRYAGTKGTLLILMVGLVSALLIVAACGGTSKAATAEPTAESGPTSADPGPIDATVPPGESGQAQETTKTVAQGVPTPGLLQSVFRVETSAPEPSIAPAQVSGSPAYPSIQYSTSQQVGIWVTGKGEVTVAPDLAILSAGVEARAITVEEARTEAAQAMDRMVQALNARGIQSGDIQTRFFNISPEYKWNDLKKQQELVGYRVSNQVSVKIRDIGSVGIIIDELAAAGGDLVRIQGVRFTVEDTEALEIQAREKAVQALMAKAQQYADLTGVQLGKLVFLSETSGFTPRGFDNQRAFAEAAPAAAQATTTISGGELKVTITIQGVFTIV